MKRIRTLCVVLLVAIIGCADGGPVGTGITSSSIGGNVVDVETSSGSAASVAGVQVSIDEAPGVENTTDADGNFELVGDFSGPVTVRFRAAEVTATQPLDVAEGSTIAMQDITIRPGAVLASVIRQLGFQGHVALIDCDAGELLVNDLKVTAANQFMVRITPDTVIVKRDGQALSCGDIGVGAAILIQGVIRLSDRTVIATTLTVGPPPATTQPAPTADLRFRGIVAVVNCASGMIAVVNDVTGPYRLRLAPTTVIVTGDQRPLSCRDIHVGDQVEGVGVIKVRSPGVIDARTMIVRRPVQP